MGAILSHISPVENPSQVVLTALRALANIADATRLAPPGLDDTTALSEALFKPHHVSSLYRILASGSTALAVQEQKCLVSRLITLLCRGAQQQNMLASQGILDALATILASFVVQRGEVVPGAEIMGEADGLINLIPEPAPLGADLSLTLEAISTIIADSPYRSCMLICSPAVVAVFPKLDFTPPAKETRVVWHTLETSGLCNFRSRTPGAMDYRLPLVPINQPRSISAHYTQFPPLGFSLSNDNLASLGVRSSSGKFTWDTSRFDSTSVDPAEEETESPLVPWLIHLIRSTDGLTRVNAASVLASLFKAGFTFPEREVAISHLVVPLLCQMLKDHDKEIPPSARNSVLLDHDTVLDWAILERTPTILARLVADSDLLAQAAYDCGAMKTVHKLLKDSYEPMPNQLEPRQWSPTPERTRVGDEGLPTCRMGPPGRIPLYAHRIKMRESSLKLAAGLISLKEEYRKNIAEQESVPYIVESLSAHPRKPRSAKEKARAGKSAEDADGPNENSPYGVNPSSVILAACHVVRVLGRSVSNLRTTLEDHGVATPIFHLLRHPEAEIQVAACAAACNLVLTCSPMREVRVLIPVVFPVLTLDQKLLELGILCVLCEHARSQNPGMRLNAMWALKALVEGADHDLKKQALEELTPGWLIQLIITDTEDDALHNRMGLDAEFENDQDMDTDALYDDDDDSYESYLANLAQIRPKSERLQRAEVQITRLRETELNPVRKARNDDMAIQEQGLNFIRNLISSPSVPGEMVDYVFGALGQDRLFEILASKLHSKATRPYGRRNNASDSRIIFPQAQVIEAVIYVLVNMAASIPKHRQLVIAQTRLLKLLSSHIDSNTTTVRLALCHLINNLGESEGDNDGVMSGQRAMELRKLGILAQLEELERRDASIDVRERAKSAVWKLKASAS